MAICPVVVARYNLTGGASGEEVVGSIVVLLPINLAQLVGVARCDSRNKKEDSSHPKAGIVSRQRLECRTHGSASASRSKSGD